MDGTQSGAARTWFTRFVDMFAYPLRHSHYLELVNPLWTNHTLQARVEKVWDETRDSRTITLRPGRGWRTHRAGQHIRVGVPIGGMRHTRTYSIASPPEREDGCITITVKAIAGGRVSHYLVRQLKVGSYLPIGEPQGDFVLPDAVPVLPLFITAGSGITPVMSMLRSYAAEFEHLPNIVHIHYAPHAYDVIFGDELRQLAAAHPHYQLHLIYTRGLDGGGESRAGERYFSARQLEALCADWCQREVWATGPAALLGSLESHWQRAGLARALHIERFRAKLAAIPDGATGGRVRFTRSNIESLAAGNLSLLRVAEDAGLNPPHGCRMGICHGCDARLVAGCVRDLRSGALCDEAGQKIQICVSAAAGDVELEV
jgi:ferredoxin-NADP reductase